MISLSRTKKLFLVFIIITFSHLSFSQTHFEPGFIVKQSRDTIRGFLQIESGNRSPKSISFKKDLSKTGMDLYSPKELSGFGISGQLFESATVDVMASIPANEIPDTDSKLATRKDTVFLHLLIKGQKTLAQFVDENDREHFYIKEGANYNLLVYKKYVQETAALPEGDSSSSEAKERTVKENKRYTGQLRLYMQDCPETFKTIEKCSYTVNGLTTLFATYYTKIKRSPAYQIKPDRIEITYGALAGLSMTSLKLKSSGTLSDLTDASFKNGAGLTAGLFLNVILPGTKKKWSINNELIYTSYQFTQHVSGDLFNKDYRIGYSYLKLNNMVRYKIPTGKNDLFFNVGISNGFAIRETNTMTRYSNANSYDPVPAIDETRKYEQCFNLGIGTTLQRISIEIRDEMGNGMSTYDNLKSSTNRLYLLLGYRF
ncbi:MAG: PorT family protein [Marinilabiliales bacterium]|nr:PorT family protein [Marinilabiliales bacterium]